MFTIIYPIQSILIIPIRCLFLFPGKPKLFLIQACRGEGTIRSASTSNHSNLCNVDVEQLNLRTDLPIDSDQIVFYASTPGISRSRMSSLLETSPFLDISVFQTSSFWRHPHVRRRLRFWRRPVFVVTVLGHVSVFGNVSVLGDVSENGGQRLRLWRR